MCRAAAEVVGYRVPNGGTGTEKLLELFTRAAKWLIVWRSEDTVVTKFSLTTCSLMLAVAGLASAGTLTENFDNVPGWESGWFGVNSNAQNYYGIGAGRGNNPDGLWIQDSTPGDGDINIVFNHAFALTLTGFSMDVAGYTPTNLIFYDASGNVLANYSPITDTSGAYTKPGVYQNYSVSSANGIGGFRFVGASPEGNTSIDNLVATTGTSSVPEPATWSMLIGAALLLPLRRKLIAKN
jgi:hypothetical protein